jgi:hypothetical protein
VLPCLTHPGYRVEHVRGGTETSGEIKETEKVSPAKFVESNVVCQAVALHVSKHKHL